MACPAGTAANSLKTQCTDYAEIDGSITEFSVIENIMNESRMVLSRRQSDGTIAKNVVVKAKVPVPSDALATLQDVALAVPTEEDGTVAVAAGFVRHAHIRLPDARARAIVGDVVEVVVLAIQPDDHAARWVGVGRGRRGAGQPLKIFDL